MNLNGLENWFLKRRSSTDLPLRIGMSGLAQPEIPTLPGDTYCGYEIGELISMPTTGNKLSILMIGAHPDDCELKAAGAAIQWARLGHRVQFVALTGGDNGHPSMGGGALQQRRRKEAQEAARILGIYGSDVLENHGGELFATLEMRHKVVRLIREARADVVISHRSTD